MNGGVAVSSVYDYGNDTLGRLLATEALNYDSTSGLRHEFNYLGVENVQNRTTNFINSVEIKKKVEGNWVSLGEKFNYTYDNLGNITDVTDLNNSLIAHYEYDSLNQLIRENNVQTGKTVTYQYNVGGNLTEKKTYSYTTDADLTNATLESTVAYTYGDSNWPDKLTSITCGENEQALIYDAIGNPLAYRDGWKCEWSRGHRLDKIENSGYNVNVTFKYNEGGIRNQKTVNGVQTDFITSCIKLLGQKTGENVLLWQVDGNGNTIGFNYNNIPYFYMKNLQGDIVGITDASGNIVAKYTYDSWGKLISIKDASDVDKTTDTTFIGYVNPLRYRGYYYDSETGFYYLNARYYDPEVGRFISADETLIGGYNLFEYCYNNPIGFADFFGTIPEDIIQKVVELANIVRHESFGKRVGKQWGYAMFAYRIDGVWYNSQPVTKKDSNAVNDFVNIESISDELHEHLVDTIVSIHTHPVHMEEDRSGKYWCYQDGFSTDGVNNDIRSYLRNWEDFQYYGVKSYYGALVVANGNVFVYDPITKQDYIVARVEEDPNMRLMRSSDSDECIIT